MVSKKLLEPSMWREDAMNKTGNSPKPQNQIFKKSYKTPLCLVMDSLYVYITFVLHSKILNMLQCNADWIPALKKKNTKKPHAGMVVNLVFSFLSHIYMVT